LGKRFFIKGTSKIEPRAPAPSMARLAGKTLLAGRPVSPPEGSI